MMKINSISVFELDNYDDTFQFGEAAYGMDFWEFSAVVFKMTLIT